MLLLKEEVLAASRVSSQGAMQDPAGGDGGISNCIPRNNGHGIQTTTSTFPSDLTATFQVPSPGAQLGGKDGGTLASSDEAPSEFDNTTHPSLPDAFKDDVATSGTDGVEDEPPARSGDNLDKGPAVDEDNVNLASSEPSYKAAAPQPIQMEVQHPPSSSPTSATDDIHQCHRWMTPTQRWGGTPHVPDLKDQGETPVNQLPSLVVETRASKRRRTPSVRFSSPEPVLKKIKGKGRGNKKPGPRKQKLQLELPPLPDVCTSSSTSPTKPTSTFETPRIVGWPFRWEYDLGEGVIVANSVFQSFFESSQPQPISRLRKEGIKSYDFMPASFVNALRGEYQQFCRVRDQVANLSEETIAIAAHTYAVEAFAAFNPEHLNDFPIA
ncbi:hypothetical protein DY000_02016750 [Brassica cretica]|uniref:Uncharacterized protein n=1 Tax=Brassica cretica TaxID=69181 RepID=A0ABQ7CYV8_BRACR|nr:hypothetical protein DY000_02016750 [Brassica cretica]